MLPAFLPCEFDLVNIRIQPSGALKRSYAAQQVVTRAVVLDSPRPDRFSIKHAKGQECPSFPKARSGIDLFTQTDRIPIGVPIFAPKFALLYSSFPMPAQSPSPNPSNP